MSNNNNDTIILHVLLLIMIVISIMISLLLPILLKLSVIIITIINTHISAINIAFITNISIFIAATRHVDTDVCQFDTLGTFRDLF